MRGLKCQCRVPSRCGAVFFQGLWLNESLVSYLSAVCVAEATRFGAQSWVQFNQDMKVCVALRGARQAACLCIAQALGGLFHFVIYPAFVLRLLALTYTPMRECRPGHTARTKRSPRTL